VIDCTFLSLPIWLDVQDVSDSGRMSSWLEAVPINSTVQMSSCIGPQRPTVGDATLRPCRYDF